MMNWLFEHAPVVGLLFFFGVFVVVAVWAYWPSRKQQLEAHGLIPFQDQASPAAPPPELPLRESNHG